MEVHGFTIFQGRRFDPRAPRHRAPIFVDTPPIVGVACESVAMITNDRVRTYMVDQELQATTDLPKRGKVTIKFGELIVSSDFDSGTIRQGV